MGTPALGIVEVLGGMLARLRETFDISCQRVYSLAYVSILKWPVIHLLIDIQVHITIPRRPSAIRPDTL